MTLPRGFKAAAERRAAELRAELGLPSASPINVNALAAHLGVETLSADELIDRGRLEELERLQAYSFSAATIEVRGQAFIVTNPIRSLERLASDVAHELAHILLKHDLTEIRDFDGVPFRTCEPAQEEQATAFGGTLLLPRALLVTACRAGFGPEDIARQCGVTLDMARYRYNTTGVARQAAATRRLG